MFEHVVAALVHGSGYERIASPGCSDRTIRRRLKAWAALGIGEQVHALALRAYDQMIGLELEDVAVGASPRRRVAGSGLGRPGGPPQGGLKRSVATEDHGIPLGIASAGANRHDSPLLAPTLQAAHRQLGALLPADRTSRPLKRLFSALAEAKKVARGPGPARWLPCLTEWVLRDGRPNGVAEIVR